MELEKEYKSKLYPFPSVTQQKIMENWETIEQVDNKALERFQKREFLRLQTFSFVNCALERRAIFFIFACQLKYLKLSYSRPPKEILLRHCFKNFFGLVDWNFW